MRAGLVATVVLCTTTLLGQPRIVVDPQHPERDTLDFGATLVGIPRCRPVYLINPTEDTLRVCEPVRPYFSIERTPDQSGDIYDYLEFEPQSQFPVIVPPRQTQQLWLCFQAPALLSAAGIKLAALRLSLYRSCDTSTAAAARTLILRGLKAEVQVSWTPATLNADSVFVGSEKALQTLLRIAPTPISTAEVDTTLPIRWVMRYRSAPEGTELQVDGVPPTVAVRRLDIPINLRYRPENPGPDTIELRLLYRPYPQAAEEDTAVLLTTGFGVHHRLSWDIVAAPPGISRSGDTIDFGRVRLGSTASVRIRLVNGGNYRFHATDSLVPQTPEAVAAFGAIPSPFPPEGIAPGDTVELELSFHPQTAGMAEAVYVLTSDVDRRVSGVPWEARRWELVLRGSGIGPRLQAVPATVEVRFLWSPSCPRALDYTLTLRNLGTDLLRIDSLFLSSGVAVELPGLSLPIELPPGSGIPQRLRIAPPDTGVFTDTLILVTNIPNLPRASIPIHVVSLAPTPVLCWLPTELRAKPGSRLWLPLFVDSLPDSARTCRIVLSYDPSLLRWETLRTDQTALEGARIHRAGEEQPGVFVLEAEQPYGWLKRYPVLIELGFRVFLGSRLSTELTPQQVLLGDTSCPEFWRAQAVGGHLVLDSVCGLDAKLLPYGSLRLELPALLSDDLVPILYELPFDGPVDIALFNTAGVRVRTFYTGWQRGGTYAVQWSLRELGAGLYFCRLQFGELVIVRAVVVQR